MAVPVLPLNLAPRPSLWRQRHQTLGWTAIGLGVLVLLGSIGFTWSAYHQASRAGRDAVSLTEEARRASHQEQQLQSSLQDMDAGREQSRWKLAEKILQERSLPWSRLTAELEQCMVPDMRLKGIQRARSNNQQVLMKLKGEAKTREAEAAFVEALRGTPVFAQVVLEREAERAGGGWDFELSLPAAAVPPPFHVKAIKVGVPAPAPTPVRASAHPVAVAAPIRPPAPAPARPPVPAPVRPAAAPTPAPAPTIQPPPPPSGDQESPARPRRTRVRPSDARSPE